MTGLKWYQKLALRIAGVTGNQPPARKNWGGYSILSGGRGYGGDLSYIDIPAAQAATHIEDVYACLEARVSALTGIGWELRVKSGDVPSEDDDIVASSKDLRPRHPFGQALQDFRIKNGYDLFHTWYYSKLVTGKFFMQPLKNDADYYTGIEWYNPLGVQIIELNGQIAYFQYSGRSGVSLQFVPIVPNPVSRQYALRADGKLIYDHTLNLIDEYEGMSPVEAAINSIRIESTARDAMLAYFKNGMRIGAIISPRAGGVLSDEETREIIAEMRDKNSGAHNTGRNAYIPFDIEVSYPQGAGTGMQSDLTVREDASKRIQRVLRVPSWAMGDLGATRYKESSDQLDAWISTVILPDAHQMRDLINGLILPLFDDTGDIYFAWDERFLSLRVSEAQIDQRTVAKMDLDAGAITIAQYNRRVGVEMDESDERNLEVRYIPPQVLLVRNEDLGTLGQHPHMTSEDVASVVEAQQRQTAPDAPSDDELQIEELRTWRKFSAKTRNRDFTFEHLPELLRTRLQEYQQAGKSVNEAHDAVLEYIRPQLGAEFIRHCIKAHTHAISLLPNSQAQRDASIGALSARLTALKTIQSTRLNFEMRIEDVLAESLAGNIDRRRFSIIMNNLVGTTVNRAFRDGLIDGGVEDEPDADEMEWIESYIAEQRGFVREIADEIYREGGGFDPLARAPMWFNKSIYPAYEQGLFSASANATLEWVYGDAEHCHSCTALNGQVRRTKVWQKTVLPKSDELECKGFNCKCNLVPTDRPVTRGRLPKWQKHVCTSPHDC